MLLNMNFSNLSVEGYATFILALIFTIISISAFIYFARHKNLNKVLTILIALVAPCLAIFFWVYMLLVVLGYTLVISLCSALACAVGYVGIALAFALLINHYIKTKPSKPQKVKIEEVETTDVETEEEEVPAFTPVLLIEDKKSKRKKKQGKIEDEVVVEDAKKEEDDKEENSTENKEEK